ncbi:MAG: molybdate ABC transporter permease subunit [Bacteroidota bacterium]
MPPLPPAPFDFSPLLLSLQLALLTTALLFLISLPLAYFLAYSRFRGRPVIEALVALPLVLPPSVLGFYLLLGLGPESALGSFLHDMIGLELAFSFGGLLLASMIYSLPFMVQPIQAAFQALPDSYREAAWTLGKSRWQTLRYVLLPNIKPGLLTGIVLAFAHTLGEFGVVLMIGGNIPGETRVASVAIYEEFEALNHANAHTYAAILLGISFVVLVTVYALNKRNIRTT